ncbi:MAG: radical SAM protein [Candidatus Omnitrophota bacterium]
MKVLFINPSCSLEELYGDLAGGGNELPPQTLAALAAVTRRGGYDTAILDCPVLKMDMAAILKKVADFSPDYVGITATTITMENAGRIAAGIKANTPSAKIIAGGPHVTALVEDTLERFPEIDIGVVGEGEETLIEVLRSLDRKEPLDQVRGIAFRGPDKRITVTGKRDLIRDIDTLPLPAWELLPPLGKFYNPPGDSINRMPAVGLVTSRGCPGKCIFCDNRTFGRVFRAHSPAHVLKMIRVLVEDHGVKEIYFEDDYFMASRKRLVEICNGLITAKFDLTWTCTGRISKSIDNELLKLMKRAGCWQICYGIESGSQEILDIIEKGIKLADVKECVARTRRAGLSVKGFFMLGNFLETEETIRKTMGLIRELPLTDFHMCYFVPFPGSAAYAAADRYGKFNKEWRNMNLYEPRAFVPGALTEDRMKESFKKCYAAHYFKPSVILHYARKIKNLGALKKLIVSFIAFLRFSFFTGREA